jgi:hypothetical protein
MENDGIAPPFPGPLTGHLAEEFNSLTTACFYAASSSLLLISDMLGELVI